MSASVRRPPPTWHGTSTAWTIRRITSPLTGRPSLAPSRSTRCRARAPSPTQRRAMAAGSSPNTVSGRNPPAGGGRTCRRAGRSPAGSASSRIPRVTVVSGRGGRRGKPSHSRRRRPECKSSGGPAGIGGLQPGEVLQHRQPHRLALLRVELRGEQVVAPDGRRERRRVVGRRRWSAPGSTRGGIVGVDEVDGRARPAARGRAGSRRGTAGGSSPCAGPSAPARSGSGRPRRAARPARRVRRPRSDRVNSSCRPRQMPRNGRPVSMCVDDRLGQAGLAEAGDGVAEGPDAGQHQLVGGRHGAGVAGDLGGRARPARTPSGRSAGWPCRNRRSRSRPCLAPPATLGRRFRRPEPHDPQE